MERRHIAGPEAFGEYRHLRATKPGAVTSIARVRQRYCAGTLISCTIHEHTQLDPVACPSPGWNDGIADLWHDDQRCQCQ